jgi:hypothetical protein
VRQECVRGASGVRQRYKNFWLVLVSFGYSWLIVAGFGKFWLVLALTPPSHGIFCLNESRLYRSKHERTVLS